MDDRNMYRFHSKSYVHMKQILFIFIDIFRDGRTYDCTNAMEV